MPVAKIGRRTYWEIAAAGFLLWTTYVALDVWAGFPDIPRGLAALFIVIEFALISRGTTPEPLQPLQRSEDRTKEFMAVLEQNNAMLAETLDRAVKHAYATAYVDVLGNSELGAVRRLPGPRRPGNSA